MHGHTFSATTSSYDYGSKQTNTMGDHVHSYNKSEADGGGSYSTSGNGGAWGTLSTNSAGNHAHTVTIGAHTHTVSGTTGKAGGGSEINITNAFVTLMGWYRIS